MASKPEDAAEAVGLSEVEKRPATAGRRATNAEAPAEAAPAADAKGVSVEDFIKAYHADAAKISLSGTKGDDLRALMKTHMEQFYVEAGDDALLAIRPSGNPLSRKGWVDMMCMEDVNQTVCELVSVDSSNVFAGGNGAVATYTEHTVFNYKGTDNDDVAKWSIVLEKSDSADGWKLVHLHRSTGQPPKAEEKAEGKKEEAKPAEEAPKAEEAKPAEEAPKGEEKKEEAPKEEEKKEEAPKEEEKKEEAKPAEEEAKA